MDDDTIMALDLESLSYNLIRAEDLAKGMIMEQENREQVSAFIVKVWREETADRTEQIRGLIIHIPSGNRRTITHLQEIPAFIEPFLDQQRDPFTGR